MRIPLFLRKSIAATLATLVFLTQVVLAHSAETNLWTERRRASAPLAASIPPISPLSSPKISRSEDSLSFIASAANLEGARLSIRQAAASSPIAVLIQDIHGNPEAQTGAWGLIEKLADRGMITTVGLEGAFRPANTSAFSRFSDKSSLKKAITYLVSQGKLPGATAAALISSRELALVGIDDKPLYDVNVHSYLSSRSIRPSVEAKLDQARADLSRQKISPRLKAFDDNVRAYREGRSTLGGYLTSLVTAAGRSAVTVDAFRHALALESQLDSSAVERERAQLMSRLGQRLDAGAARDLLADTVAFRAGRLNGAAFYGKLFAALKNAGVSIEATPHFQNYLSYLQAADSVDGQNLFLEIDELENAAYERLAGNQDDKIWAARSRFLAVARKLTSFGLGATEWALFQRLASDDRLASARAGLPDLTPFAAFYEAAQKRDARLAENLLGAARKSGDRRIAAVVGGFHSEGLASRLNQAGWTVAVVTPRLSKADVSGGSAYLTAFAREKTPLEKIFTPERLFVAPDPLAGAAQVPVLTAAVRIHENVAADPAPDLKALSPNVPFTSAKATAHGDHVDVTVMEGGVAAETIVTFDSAGAITDATEPPPQKAEAVKPTVLLIEDQDDTRVLNAMVLEAYGYRVISAADGASAMRLISEHRAEINVIVSDFDLPDFNGDEIYRRVRAERAYDHIAYTFLSGRSRESLSDEGIPSSVPNVIKGSSIDKIITMVADAVAAGVPKRAMTMLYIEDNAVYRSNMVAALSSLGFDLMVVENGAAAMAALERNPNIAMILSDVDLPDFNGDEVYRRAQADTRFRSIPFAFLTARGVADRATLGVPSNVPWLTKNFNFRHLAIEVHGVFEAALEPPAGRPSADVVRILLADKPASANTVDEIRDLAQSFNGRAEVLPEVGIGASKDDLGRVLDEKRPSVVVIRSGTKAFKGDPDFMRRAAADGVKVIVRAGAGVDNVDLAEAANNGIAVARTHGNANSVANLTLRFLFAGLQKMSGTALPEVSSSDEVAAQPDWQAVLDVSIEELAAAVHASDKAGRGKMSDEDFKKIFPALSPASLRALVSRLNGKTIGLIGFGPIAQDVARKLGVLRQMTGATFQMAATSRSLDQGEAGAVRLADELGVLHPGADAVLKKSDVISLHLPSSRDTKKYLSAEKLNGSQAAIVINTSRQDLVDSELWAGAQTRFDYYADVDFTADLADIASRHSGRVHLVPHIGASTANAAAGVEKNTLTALSIVIARLSGETPRLSENLDVVNGVAVGVPSVRPNFVFDSFVRAWLVGTGWWRTLAYIAIIGIGASVGETYLFQALMLPAFPGTAPLMTAALVLISASTFAVSHLVANRLSRDALRRLQYTTSQIDDLAPPLDLIGVAYHFAVGLGLGAIFAISSAFVGAGAAIAVTSIAHSILQVPAAYSAWQRQAQASGIRGRISEILIPLLEEFRGGLRPLSDAGMRFLRGTGRTAVAIFNLVMTVVILTAHALWVPSTAFTRRWVPAPPSVNFLSGAGEVGANATLVSIGGKLVLVDVGLKVGGEVVPDFSKLTGVPDAIVITHAHTDHIGALPIIHKMYPRIPIYASPATLRLMKTMLPQSLRSLRNHGIKQSDIHDTLKSVITLENDVRHKVGDQAWLKLFPAGHLHGARSVEMGSLAGHVVVTGDISMQTQRTVGPAVVPSRHADILVSETTMGDRPSPPRAGEEKRLVDSVKDTLARGGNVIIPSLALGRAQEVLSILRDAQESGELPSNLILFDGMINATNAAYEDSAYDLPKERREIVERNGGKLYGGEDVEIRAALNGERSDVRAQLTRAHGPGLVVVAPAGMLNGGHILDYLQAGFSNPLNRVFFVNYQPTGGLGRRILDSKPGDPIFINGREVSRRADVESFTLSGHAGADDLVDYIVQAQPRRGGLALVHGHVNALRAMVARPELARFRPYIASNGDTLTARRPPLFRSLWRLIVALFRRPVPLPLPPDLRAPDNMFVFTRAAHPFGVALAGNVHAGSDKFRARFLHTSLEPSLHSSDILDRFDISAVAATIQGKNEMRALIRRAVSALEAARMEKIVDALRALSRQGSFTAEDLAARLGLTTLEGRLGAVVFLMSFPDLFDITRGRYTLKDELPGPLDLQNRFRLQLFAPLGEVEPDLDEVETGSVVLVDSQNGLSPALILGQHPDGGIAAVRSDKRFWAPRTDKTQPRVEVPFQLGPRNGRLSRVIGSLNELLVGSESERMLRFRAFAKVADGLVPGDARSVWLMVQAVAGGEAMTLDEMADALLTDESEAALGLRAQFASLLRPETSLPGGPDEVAAHNSLQALIGGRIDIALRIVLATRLGKSNHYFSEDRVTGVITPISPAELSAKYSQTIAEIDHEIGVFALPLRSEITLPAGSNLYINRGTPPRVTLSAPTSAFVLRKGGRYVTIMLELNGQREITTINIKRVRLLDQDQTPDLNENTPTDDDGGPKSASIPFLARSFAGVAGWIADYRRAEPLMPDAVEARRAKFVSIYRSWIAWISEAPLAPGLGGYLLSLAFLAFNADPTAAWIAGQFISAIVFGLLHWENGGPKNGSAWFVAASGFVVTLFVRTGGPMAALISTVVVAIIHLVVNNAPKFLPSTESIEVNNDRRAFLRGVAALTVDVAGRGTVMKAIMALGNDAGPLSAVAPVVRGLTGDQLGVFLKLLDERGLTDEMMSVVIHQAENLPPEVHAMEARRLSTLAPDRLKVLRELASLWKSDSAGTMTIQALTSRVRGIMQQIIPTQVPPSAQPSAPRPAYKTPSVPERLVPGLPESNVPERDFFSLTSEIGLTQYVVAAALQLQLDKTSEATRDFWESDTAAQLDRLPPMRRELVVDLARLYIDADSKEMPAADLLSAAETLVADYRAALRRAFPQYVEQEPYPRPEPGSPRDEMIAVQFSDLTSRAYIGTDWSLLKRIAINAGIDDETVARAIQSLDMDVYRSLALDMHPYAIRAKAALDQFFSVFEFHEGAFYAMRELHKAGQLPEGTVLVNVDPHSDMAHADDPSTPLVAGTWAGHALRDGLAAGYLQIGYDTKGAHFRLWYATPDGEMPYGFRMISAEEARKFLEGKAVFLTVDADAFSLRQQDPLGPFHLEQDGIAARFLEIESLLKSAGVNVVRVVGAISPEYLDHIKATKAWSDGWESTAAAMADRMKPEPSAGERLGVSVLFGGLFKRAGKAGRAVIALVGAPSVESALIGGIFGLWPFMLPLSPIIAMILVPLLSGLFFMVIHPRVFDALDGTPRTPTFSERVELFLEGAMYGFTFAAMAQAHAAGFHGWLAALLTTIMIHALMNAVAILNGEMVSVGGAKKSSPPSGYEKDVEAHHRETSDEVHLMAQVLANTDVVRGRLGRKASRDDYGLRDLLTGLAGLLIDQPGHVSRRDIREWLEQADGTFRNPALGPKMWIERPEGPHRGPITPAFSPSEHRALAREIFSPRIRDIVDALRRSGDSAVLTDQIAEAFERRDAVAYRYFTELFSRKFGGRAVLVSLDDKAEWLGFPIVRENGFTALEESITHRIPTGFPTNRADAATTVRTILNSSAHSHDRVSLLMIEPERSHAREFPEELMEIVGTVRLTTANNRWALSPATRLQGTEWGRSSSSYKGPGIGTRNGLTRTVIRVVPGPSARPAFPGALLGEFTGGSNSSIEQRMGDDGQSIIVKYAPATVPSRASAIPGSEARYKLRGEAAVMESLYAKGHRFLPRVEKVEERGDQVVVTMEDLSTQGFVPAAQFLFFDYYRHVPPTVIWNLAMDILETLAQALYRPWSGTTPPNFVEEKRIEHVRRRLSQAGAESPVIDELVKQPVVIVRNILGGMALPNFEALVPFINAVLPYVTPPSVRNLMGDLHLGNTLVNPMEFEARGRFQSFRLLDFNARSNDYLYDIAKLIHSFYGRYELLRMPELYGYMREDDVQVAPGHTVPVYEEWFEDEEVNPTPFGVTDDLTDVFIEWLRNADNVLEIENGTLWKARLLFTHAIAMLGLAPYHLSHDQREVQATGMYLMGLQLLMETLDLIINGAFDDGLPDGRSLVPAEARTAWNLMADSLLGRTPDRRPRSLATHRFQRSRIDAVREALHSARPELALQVIGLMDGVDMGTAAYQAYNLLGRHLSLADKDLLIRTIFRKATHSDPLERARELGMDGRMTKRTRPQRDGKPAFVAVTLNPVVDVTTAAGIDFRGDGFSLHAGGKGLNMARALKEWTRHDPVALGFIGGDSGALLAALAENEGVPSGLMTTIKGRTRMSVAATHHYQTGDRFAGQSPQVSATALRNFHATFEQNVKPGDVVLLGGSLPPGVPANEYGRLVNRARDLGARIYVDASGETLARAIDANPDFVGINLSEFADAVGIAQAELANDHSRVAALAAEWVRRGIHTVVVTMGGDGTVMVTRGTDGIEAWKARSPKVQVADTSGAGDSVKVAFAYAESEGRSAVDALRLATAAGAVTVAKSGADMSTLQEAEDLVASVETAKLSVPAASPVGVSVLLGWLYQRTNNAGRAAIALLGSPVVESLLIGALFGLWPYFFPLAPWLAMTAIPFASGLFFMLIHPVVFDGVNPLARRPSSDERFMMFIEGVMYGALFAGLSLSGHGLDQWLSALITNVTLHALLNGVAISEGTAVSVGGGAPSIVDAASRLLKGTRLSRDVESIDGRIHALEQSAQGRAGTMDSPEALLVFQRFVTNLGPDAASGSTAAQVANGVAVVMIDQTLAAKIPEIVARERAKAGTVLFVTQSENLSNSVEATLRNADGAASAVVSSPTLFSSIQGGATLSLAGLSALLAHDARFSGRPVSRIVASESVAFDSSGLGADDPLREALFIVLSALGPVTLTSGQIERIGTLARLVGRQA